MFACYPLRYFSDENDPSRAAKPEEHLVKHNRLIFGDREQVKVMSHDGQWQGTDDDFTVQLNRDGTLKITEFGYSVFQLSGKFQLTQDKTIIIKPNRGPAWLPMPWMIDNGDLLILHPKKEVMLEAARKAGVPEVELTDEAIEQALEQWPLRQVRTPDKAEPSDATEHSSG